RYGIADFIYACIPGPQRIGLFDQLGADLVDQNGVRSGRRGRTLSTPWVYELASWCIISLMGVRVAVAGASGYAGGELLRLLAGHPELEVTAATAHGNAGQALADVHPQLVSYGDLVLGDTTAEALSEADLVFLALPHGA